ncbi:hypothetical protein EBT31_13835 [bacterium]|jgi:ribosome maturation factor RimP|nr:hypothetical protein [bacterium]
MTPAMFTRDAFEPHIGENVIIDTKDNSYEGELIDTTETVVTMLWFSIVKDEVRELDIPYKDIISFREEL